MCADEATAIWFTVGRPVCLFPCASGRLAHRPSSNRTDTFWFSLPSSKLSFRVPSIQSLRCTFVRRDYLLWVSALFSTPPRRAQFCRTSTVLLAWPPVFSTVRRLPQRDLQACFILQPSSGPLLVQGFDHLVQPSVFIRLSTPLPLSIPTLTCKQAATYEHLDSDVLLHTRALSIWFGN
jgi:hypothetical protein